MQAGRGPGDAAGVSMGRRKRSLDHRPFPLTIRDILRWADGHCARLGVYPKYVDGPVHDAPLGLNWWMVDNALRIGLRGLPGGSSLARLLAARRGVRNKQALPSLTEYLIETWARAHHQQHGAWPREDSGPIDAAPGETWQNINACLQGGFRGLPGGETLPQLLGRRCGARTWATMPRLTFAGILAWADSHHADKGQWPHADSGPIDGAAGETWAIIDAALVHGCRGLKGRSSLAKLLAKHRGKRHKGQLPRLTIRRILRWADAWHHSLGSWPKSTSGAILESGGETWAAVNMALHQGLRGLPGGDSLAALLQRRRGMENRQGRRPS
jgi:hypothetical protein